MLKIRSIYIIQHVKGYVRITIILTNLKIFVVLQIIFISIDSLRSCQYIGPGSSRNRIYWQTWTIIFNSFWSFNWRINKIKRFTYLIKNAFGDIYTSRPKMSIMSRNNNDPCVPLFWTCNIFLWTPSTTLFNTLLDYRR